MEVSEIRNRESLRAWLEALPHETEAERAEARRWAIAIAHRASFRASTIFIDSHLDFQDLLDSSDLIELFRCLLIPTVFVHSANDGLIASAASISAPSVPVASRFAGREASRANCLMLASERFVELALTAIDYVTETVNERAVWHTVKEDCRAISAHTNLERLPIWPSDDKLADIWPEENPILVVWYRSREILQSLGEGWHFWVDWYENALHPLCQGSCPLVHFSSISQVGGIGR